jgi:hypothetical protein
MIMGAAFVISIGVCLLLLRRARRLVLWVGAAVTLFVTVFAIAKGLQDVPTDTEVAQAYRAGVISYNEYERGTDRAHAAYDYAAIAGATSVLLLAAAGSWLQRVGAVQSRAER